MLDILSPQVSLLFHVLILFQPQFGYLGKNYSGDKN